MERLFQLQNLEIVEKSNTTLTIAEETSQMAIDDTSFDRLLSAESGSHVAEGKNCLPSPRDTPTIYQTKILKYLAHSYNETMNEEKNYPKVSNWRTRYAPVKVSLVILQDGDLMNSLKNMLTVLIVSLLSATDQQS